MSACDFARDLWAVGFWDYGSGESFNRWSKGMSSEEMEAFETSIETRIRQISLNDYDELLSMFKGCDWSAKAVPDKPGKKPYYLFDAVVDEQQGSGSLEVETICMRLNRSFKSNDNPESVLGFPEVHLKKLIEKLSVDGCRIAFTFVVRYVAFLHWMPLATKNVLQRNLVDLAITVLMDKLRSDAGNVPSTLDE